MITIRERTDAFPRACEMMARMPIEEGFQGQRLLTLPRPLIEAALHQPVTRRMLVTDAGHYPDASEHEMHRPQGAAEHIVIVCVSGRGWARIHGHTHRVPPGSLLMIPVATPHVYGADPEDPWTIWWAHMAGTDVPELVAATGATRQRPVLELGSVERIVALLDEIVTALERVPSSARLLRASGVAWKLFTEIAIDQILPRSGDPLQRAMSYLEQRLDGSIRVPELAALVGVSPSHLTALFRRATGGGVLAHQTALRMGRARVLLDTTDATVTEIAHDLGYSDAFYFSRQFRRHHDMSPTAFRARNAP